MADSHGAEADAGRYLLGWVQQAVEYGLSDASELAAIAGAWRRWSGQPDGYFAVVHGEVLARR